MTDQVGFTSMAGARAEGDAPEIGIGMLGYAFMGKAHTNALKKLPYMMYPPVAIPRLVAICGRNAEATAEAANAMATTVTTPTGARCWKTTPFTFSTTAAPMTPTPNPRLPLPRRASTSSVKSRCAYRRRSQEHVGRGAKSRRQAHGRLQLSLRPGHRSGQAVNRKRRVGAHFPLPRRLPARVDYRPQFPENLAAG